MKRYNSPLCTFLCITLVSLIFISCDNKEIKEFAKSFAFAVNAEDLDKIKAMIDSTCQYNWKNVEIRDIDPDSIIIKQQSASTYFIECVDSTKFVISKESNRYVIKSTYNVINVDNHQKNFAQLKGLINENMNDYTIYQTINSELFFRLLEEQRTLAKENAIFISNQKKIPSLLEDYEKSISTIDTLVKENDYSISPNFFITTLGTKVLMYANFSRKQVAKYEKYMTDEQRSRYVNANKRFQYYMDNRDSI